MGFDLLKVVKLSVCILRGLCVNGLEYVKRFESKHFLILSLSLFFSRLREWAPSIQFEKAEEQRQDLYIFRDQLQASAAELWR